MESWPTKKWEIGEKRLRTPDPKVGVTFGQQSQAKIDIM